MTRYNTQDFVHMKKRFRANFINSLSGFKSANLIGTKSAAGQENLTLVSSVFHVGSDPATLGLIFRPQVVPRHGYENIMSTQFFTVNHISKHFYKAAHQSSAKYPHSVSEFNAVGLRPEYLDNHLAPYVADSQLKIGCKLVETYDTKFNPTHIVIAEIVAVYVEDLSVDTDGTILCDTLDTVSITGLDTYHTSTLLAKLPYAKI